MKWTHHLAGSLAALLLPAIGLAAAGSAHKTLSSYKVIFVPFGPDGKPNGPPRDVLTGFIGSDGTAHGRPVGLTIDRAGALLVADDVGNAVWQVSAAR
jgi:glucose/arabinose dehydrogenase